MPRLLFGRPLDTHQTIMSMQEQQVLNALSALAQKHRLQIFRALVVVGEAGLKPGDLVDRMGVSAATLSFHLKELAESGLVTQTRDGRNMIYRANYAEMDGLLAYLTENCCEGKACEVSATDTNTCGSQSS